MYTEANTCLYMVKWVYTRRQTCLHEKATSVALYLASDLYCTYKKNDAVKRSYVRGVGNFEPVIILLGSYGDFF